MNGLQNPVVVLAVLAWLAAPPQSLGDASQKEAFRRHIMPKSRASLTGIGLRPETPAAAATPPAASGADVESTPQVAGKEAMPAKANAGQDEAFWRKRMDTARQAVDQDQAKADGLQTRINGLQRDIVKPDDPAQQAKLRQELQKALAELDKAKKQVDDDRVAIRTIQEEARRLDVPAGWIRY